MAHEVLEPQEDTRERLLAAALSQFAQRGFYGASIAQIAGELGLSKQALLYYFKRKEDLYAEVLKRIADRLLSVMHESVDAAHSPERQFEAIILGFYEESQQHPLHTRLLLRELLDNQHRDAPPEKWFLRTFFDAIVGKLDKIDSLGALPSERKFLSVYQILSGVEYFTVSAQTLRRMYGDEEYERIAAAFPHALRGQVRSLIDCAPGC